jgi:hypothetical protein
VPRGVWGRKQRHSRGPLAGFDTGTSIRKNKLALRPLPERGGDECNWPGFRRIPWIQGGKAQECGLAVTSNACSGGGRFLSRRRARIHDSEQVILVDLRGGLPYGGDCRVRCVASKRNCGHPRSRPEVDPIYRNTRLNPGEPPLTRGASGELCATANGGLQKTRLEVTSCRFPSSMCRLGRRVDPQRARAGPLARMA